MTFSSFAQRKVCLFVVLGMELRVWCMLGDQSITELTHSKGYGYLISWASLSILDNYSLRIQDRPGEILFRSLVLASCQSLALI